MVISSSSANTFSSADPGFAALPVDEVLACNTDIVARIKLCYGVDRESFDRDVLALIRRYAAYVHLLPATADNYFSAPGGLLRLGLEAGFFSLQGTDGHIFSGRSTISMRRLLEPRWRHATFIAGLCCEVHRVLSHIVVTDTRGEVWSGYLQPLANWLVSRDEARYFLTWRPQAMETRPLAVFALPHIVPAEVLRYLSADNATIVPHLMASIGGMPVYRDRNVLDDLVRRSLALVVDRNLMANTDRYGSPRLGAHLERYLVDALRRLASSSSSWLPNQEKSRVWFGQDGLFLLWPSAAEDILKLLEADLLPGIPKATETLLELLLAAGVFEPQDEEHPTWTVQPPGAKATQEAAKLSSAAILFAGIDPPLDPLDVKLVRGADEPASYLPPSASQPPTRSGEQLSLMPAVASPPLTQVASHIAGEQSLLPLEQQGPEAAKAHSPATQRLSFTLQAPLRLNPVVRDALAAVVHTLNDSAGPALGCTIAQGFFVPMREFEQRGLQPSMALRALADVCMLVTSGPGAPPTFSRDFNGTPTVGIVVDPRFIAGFDIDAFALQDTGGN